MISDRTDAGLLRSGVLALVALQIVGTAVDLAMERHWNSVIRDIPWVILGVLAVALVLVAVRPRPASLRIARLLVLLVIAASAFGIWEHVRANHDAGPLDYRFETRWAGMSAPDRWWTALTKGVGPSPPLVPAVLAETGLLILLATVRHPALAPTRKAS